MQSEECTCGIVMSVFPPDHQMQILKYESVGVVLVRKWHIRQESAALRLESAPDSRQIHPFFPKSILTHFRILGMENACLVYSQGCQIKSKLKKKILDDSYLVGNLTNSKIAETKTLEPLNSGHFCISNI